MSENTLRIVLDWVPILIFFGFLIFFMRRMGSGSQKNYLQTSQQYMSDHLAEVKRTNDLLARIATALEARSVIADRRDRADLE